MPPRIVVIVANGMVEEVLADVPVIYAVYDHDIIPEEDRAVISIEVAPTPDEVDWYYAQESKEGGEGCR